MAGEPVVKLDVEYIPSTVMVKATITVVSNGCTIDATMNIVVDQYNTNPQMLEVHVQELARNLSRDIPWLDEHWFFSEVYKLVQKVDKDVLSKNRNPF